MGNHGLQPTVYAMNDDKPLSSLHEDGVPAEECLAKADTDLASDAETSRPLLYLTLVATMVLWGGTWPAGKVIASKVTPWNAAFIRFFIASLPLTIICLRLGKRSIFAVTRRQMLRLSLLGITGIFGYSTFFFMGLRTTTSSRAALIVGSIPACIALSSALFTGERMRWFGIVGIGTALCGVGTVLSHGSPSLLLAGDFNIGDLLILGCVVCWTSYTLIGKPLMKQLSPLVVVTWACILGTAILAPFAIADGLLQAIVEMDAKRWWCLLYLALFGTSLAYFWYYHALNRLGPMRTGIFINLVPIFGFVLGCLILDEKPTLSLVSGGILVVLGVTLTILAGNKRAAKPVGSNKKTQPVGGEQ